MSVTQKSKDSEEIIFYIDIITDFIKKKSLLKDLKSFMQEKTSYNPANSYGMVIFQDEKNPITVYDKSGISEIINALGDSWDTREKKQSYLENGLFEILSYIFGKSRKVERNFRVIVISDTPSERSEEYNNALYNLLIKAKNFSSSIDIIRIGDDKFYSDDVKLKIISSETYGGIFYCNHVKQFEDVLGSLVKNRKEFNIVRAKEEVLEEDRPFYERLAVDLISLSHDDDEMCTICKQELCPICEAYSDEIHKCFNCSAKYHSCCIAEYSIANNIGFKHILRCPQCETLLKLDSDFVDMVYKDRFGEEIHEEAEAPAEDVYEETYYEELEEAELESTRKQEIIESSISEEIEPEEVTEDEQSIKPPVQSEDVKKVKIGGFFGKEITIGLKKTEKKPSPQMFRPVLKSSKPPDEEEEKISITDLKPPKKKTIKICQICGTSVKFSNTCPNCGSSLK